jgi:hypothetical protein
MTNCKKLRLVVATVLLCTVVAAMAQPYQRPYFYLDVRPLCAYSVENSINPASLQRSEKSTF